MRTDRQADRNELKRKTVGGVSLFLQVADRIPDSFSYVDYAGIVTRVVDALREDDSSPSMAVCLTGPSGVGKTAVAWAVAKAMRRSCYTTQGNSDCTAQDLVVLPVPTDLNRFDPVASAICTACIEGEIGLFDEIGKVARYAPEALTPLSSMLDDRRVLWSDFLKMPFKVRDGFGFICTTQSNEPLPDYITRRMLVFTVPPPPPDILLDIVRRTTPSADGMLIESFRDWASMKVNLTPRDATLIVHFAHRRVRQHGLKNLSAKECEKVIGEAAEAVCGGGLDG